MCGGRLFVHIPQKVARGAGAEEAAPAASCHRPCYFRASVLVFQLKSAAGLVVAEPIHDTAHTSEAKGTIGPSVRALTHVRTHTRTHTHGCVYTGGPKTKRWARCARPCVCACAFGYWKGKKWIWVCVFSLGLHPRNTYHSDTSSAESSRIPSY